MNEDRVLLRMSRLLERIAVRAASEGWWDVETLAGAAALAAEERAGIGERDRAELRSVAQAPRPALKQPQGPEARVAAASQHEVIVQR